jgi:hypothetical protein
VLTDGQKWCQVQQESMRGTKSVYATALVMLEDGRTIRCKFIGSRGLGDEFNLVLEQIPDSYNSNRDTFIDSNSGKSV